MGRLKYWVVTTLLLSLFLCGYSSRGSSMVVQEVKEDYDSSYNSYNTIKLENKYITVPCKFHLLEDLGFVLNNRDNELVLEPKTFYTMLYAYNEQGDKVLLHFVNNSDTQQNIADCDVYELSVEINKDNTTSINMDLGGVSFLTDMHDAEKLLGEEHYTSDVYNDVYTASWNTEKYDRSILLSYENGTGLISIKVSVELPEDVEYSSATVSSTEESSDFIFGQDNDLYKSAELKHKTKTLSDAIKITVRWVIVGIGIFVIILICIATLVPDTDNSDAYDSLNNGLEMIEEQKKDEAINQPIDLPEKDYLEEKYKDYLDD